MRINRPDGISQENRSHPFFILLRKFADEQHELAISISKNLVRYIIITNLVVFFGLLTMIADWSYLFITLGLLIITNYGSYCKYTRFQSLLSENVFEEVSQMIYTNEYQLSNLNMEKLVNTMGDCRHTTGQMEEFNLELRNSICRIAALVVLEYLSVLPLILIP